MQIKAIFSKIILVSIVFSVIPAPAQPTSDTEAPKVDWQNSSISKTQITYGEEVSAKVRITDNVGVNDVTAYFYANYPLSGPIGAAISRRTCQLYSGDQKDGHWQCTGLIITEKLSKDDKYQIGFDAKDGAGNSRLGEAIGGVTVSSQLPPKPYDWVARAKFLIENVWIPAMTQKYSPCFTLSGPAIPEFTNNDDVNKKILSDFENSLPNWAQGIEKTIIEKCRPQPTSDTEAPKVVWQYSSEISQTQITYGVEVSVWVKITDNVGVNDATAYFYANNPVSGPIGAAISRRTCQRYSGDQKDGMWKCTGLIITEKLSKDDKYQIAIDARDGAGNSRLGEAIGVVTVSSQLPPKPYDWVAAAKTIQSKWVTEANAKYPSCAIFSIPTIPKFTSDDAKNKNLINEFEDSMTKWFLNIEKTLLQKCQPQPDPIDSWNNAVTDAINNFNTRLWKEIPNHCIRKPIEVPVFTGDQVKNGEIYNQWFKNVFNVWGDEMFTINKSKCGQTTKPDSSSGVDNSMQIVVTPPDSNGLSYVGFCFTNPKEIIGSIEFTFTNGVSGGTSYDSIVNREACPNGVLIPEAESGFYFVPGEKYFFSLTAYNNGNKYSASTTYVAPKVNTVNPIISNNTNVCKVKLGEFNQQISISRSNFESWLSLWSSYSKLSEFMKSKNLDLQTTYNYYIKNIDSEISKLEQIGNEFSLTSSLKSTCGESLIYELWRQSYTEYVNLINKSFPSLKNSINNLYPEWQDWERQNKSYDDPAVFYEQVDHYYMKYVTSTIDNFKSIGINFSFVTVPPSKPVWTNTKDGSNAKLVNDFISAISKFWEIEYPRMVEAQIQFDLKNIQTWSKNLQIGYSEMVIGAALKKFGAGGTYKFINSIPNPSQTLINNPTTSLMENYADELANWAALEIQNLKIENYTPINNGGVESQIKVCLAAIDKAKTYIGRFDSQISYLSYAWADYNRLLEILKSKDTTLLMYRVQIDQQVQSPYLSDLYDLVLPLLAGVKANCGSSSQTLKTWAETYQDIEKEILKLRNFLITISNYYEKYRFNEPKLIPQIGKITQIVGGCRVEILNYDPTFKWYAKGNMVVDVNGIATIYNGSVDQYLSTEKPGYQIVNFIEGLFKCPGIPTLSANTIDVQAPVMSLLSLSKSELYRGESFIVTVLITDNKEVNNFEISVVDQIGQTYPCYYGVAWKLRTQGDSNIGVYQIECWIRSVSYDGTWKLSGSATDLNFNSASFELAKIKVLYGEAPKAVGESNGESSSDKNSISTRTVGTAQSVALIIKDIVKNKKEEALLLNAAQKISNLPKTTRSRSLNALTSIKNQINVVIETPKVCKYKNGIIQRISKGVCSKTIEIIDSAGNQYVIAQQVKFR